MKSKYIFLVALMMIPVGTLRPTFAGDSANYLVQTSSKNCVHGLHAQPNGGSFSVFLFCDDALGSNMGIILSAPGAGPGKIFLPGEKLWDKWDVNDRFWQEKPWATDVVNILWSPSYRYLYVATSGLYGDGGFFQLDLKERVSKRLLPQQTAKYADQLHVGYFTRIENYDEKTRLIAVGIYSYGEKWKFIAREMVPLN